MRALPVEQQACKKYWDHEAGQYNLRATGWFHDQMDARLALNPDDLEGLSVRQQRHIIKKRAQEFNKIQRIKYKYHNRGMGLVMLQDRLLRQEEKLREQQDIYTLGQQNSFLSNSYHDQTMAAAYGHGEAAGSSFASPERGLPRVDDGAGNRAGSEGPPLIMGIEKRSPSGILASNLTH